MLKRHRLDGPPVTTLYISILCEFHHTLGPACWPAPPSSPATSLLSHSFLSKPATPTPEPHLSEPQTQTLQFLVNPNTPFLHFRKGVAFKSVRAPSTLRIQKTQLLKKELNWTVRTEMVGMEETGQHRLCFSCCGLDSSTMFSTSLLTRLRYHGLQPFHTIEKCFCFAFVFV